ncbi:MAG TPA: zinc-dependent metalloprotease [Chitinophagaceae bacterium]|nr:zinc-dependent metalloprotease [Chitinophagaceae bacterium]
MRQIFTRWGITVLASACCVVASAQITRTDSTRNPLGPGGSRPSNTGPRPYKEVITDKAKTDEGLFKVHKVDEKYYFEIPDAMLGREILVVNRISKAAAGMRSGFFGYAGDQIGQNVIRFEKGPNNRIFLRNISFAEYAKDSTSPMFSAVTNSNIQPISASFDIKAFSKDSTGTVIELTDYINGDNDVLFFNSNLKNSQRIGMLQSDKSYVVGVKSFPINIEVTAVKTYSRSAAPLGLGGPGGGGGGGGATGGNITVELNSSMVLLPKTPMQARYFDPRVGYFAVGYTDFDLNPQGVKPVTLVKRWRLEPKDEDVEKYKRGELVEPKKPIIFYIDPATPKKWIPYLIQGVNDWQGAFEKAGFKNAIVAKTAPTKAEDPEWSLEDARYSAIVYKPSDVPNASGPSIADPRSGEIMESHINWYHNVMQLVRDWYFVQTAAVDARARKMVFDDELMGQLIRFVSSHEVGHTLGLRHNYGSSSTVPVENLRNKAWVEANGHTPSIMDYARFNYVAQPEDNISDKGLYPRIGDYDRWAIEWGYRLFDKYKNPEQEKEYLNKWVIEKLKDKRLWFGTETNPDDPRSQSEQVGDDAMKGSMYGIKNLQRILPNLMTWTKEDNSGYNNLREMYDEVRGQFSRYMNHVAKYVGGIMETPKTVEEAGAVYEVVSEAKQREAVDFINKNLFTTPTWLLNQDIFSRTGTSGLVTIGSLQDNMLNRLLSTRTLGKLVDAEAVQGASAYQITELLSDLKKGIWSEIAAKKPVDIYRRNLQKSYVSVLTDLINPQQQSAGSIVIFFGGGAPTVNADKSDIKSVVRAHLATLRTEILAAAAGTPDAMTKFHLQDVAKRIDTALNPK